MAKRPYRLIWFHHFHKAGGSTMHASALLNHEHLYPNQINGNPLDTNGRIIPLWDFGREELHAFINDCEAKGVSFVCTEWGCPDLRVLREDPRVITVSFLREPFARLISNYEYDMLRGYERLMPVADYYFHFMLTYRQPDYYVRSLARGAGEAKTLSEASTQSAVENFNALDYVVVLGQTKGFGDLGKVLGWPEFAPRTNAKRSLGKSILRHVIKVEPERLRANYLVTTRYPRDYPAFRAVFDAANARDLKFFAEAGKAAQAEAHAAEACPTSTMERTSC